MLCVVHAYFLYNLTMLFDLNHAVFQLKPIPATLFFYIISLINLITVSQQVSMSSVDHCCILCKNTALLLIYC